MLINFILDLISLFVNKAKGLPNEKQVLNFTFFILFSLYYTKKDSIVCFGEKTQKRVSFIPAISIYLDTLI